MKAAIKYRPHFGVLKPNGARKATVTPKQLPNSIQVPTKDVQDDNDLDEYEYLKPEPPTKKATSESGGDDSDEEYSKPESPAKETENPIAVATTFTTIEKIMKEAKTLPICVRVSPAFKQRDHGDENISIQGGDVLMLHRLEQTHEVLATDKYGSDYHLPIYASQLYHILPTDPRLDDKRYRHTLALTQADPLPPAVRVVKGFYDEEEEKKEVGDILFIKGVEQQFGEDVITGEVDGYGVRYRGVEDSVEYTTMLYPDPLPLSELTKKALPLRVRTASSQDDDDSQSEQQVFTLSTVQDVTRILVSRQRDGALFKMRKDDSTLPVVTFTPSWSSVPALLSAVYPLVNPTLCQVDISCGPVPLAGMRSIPWPLERALNQWLRSYEGKSTACNNVHQEAIKMRRLITMLAEKQKGAITHAPDQAAVPPRDSRYPSISLRPRLPVPGEGHTGCPHTPSSSSRENKENVTLVTGPPRYTGSPAWSNNQSEPQADSGDIIATIGKDSPQSQAGLARTDLEKILKSLLDEKSAMLQRNEKKLNDQEERFRKLELELTLERKKVTELKDELEILKDDMDSYVTLPVGRLPPKDEDKEHHTPSLIHGSPVLPRIPLPAVPRDQASTLPAQGSWTTKHPRDEYSPPFPLTARDGASSLLSPRNERHPLPVSVFKELTLKSSNVLKGVEKARKGPSAESGSLIHLSVLAPSKVNINSDIKSDSSHTSNDRSPSGINRKIPSPTPQRKNPQVPRVIPTNQYNNSPGPDGGGQHTPAVSPHQKQAFTATFLRQDASRLVLPSFPSAQPPLPSRFSSRHAEGEQDHSVDTLSSDGMGESPPPLPPPPIRRVSPVTVTAYAPK